ncbi:hypothetical protein PENTCL1PPCAC_24281, partial [Pristionchus entomophagus]
LSEEEKKEAKEKAGMKRLMKRLKAPASMFGRWKRSHLRALQRNIFERYLAGKTDHIEVPADDIVKLIDKAKAQFELPLCELAFTRLTESIHVFGDLRGNLTVFFRHIRSLGGVGTKKWKAHKFMFLGNYINSEPHSFDVIVLLFCLKILYPKNIYLLRGYYETEPVNKAIGFHKMMKGFSEFDANRIAGALNEAFACMPSACLVEDKILLVHSGILEGVKNLSELKTKIKIISPSMDPNGPANELLMSAPKRGLKESENCPKTGARRHGEDTLLKFAEDCGLELIVRAGQMLMNGYENFAGRKVLSIYSEFLNDGKPPRNHAAVLVIKRNYEAHLAIYADDKLTEDHFRVDHNYNNLLTSLELTSERSVPDQGPKK